MNLKRIPDLNQGKTTIPFPLPSNWLSILNSHLLTWRFSVTKRASSSWIWNRRKWQYGYNKQCKNKHCGYGKFGKFGKFGKLQKFSIINQILLSKLPIKQISRKAMSKWRQEKYHVLLKRALLRQCTQKWIKSNLWEDTLQNIWKDLVFLKRHIISSF